MLPHPAVRCPAFSYTSAVWASAIHTYTGVWEFTMLKAPGHTEGCNAVPHPHGLLNAHLTSPLQHPANFKVKWNHHPCLNYAHKLHEALELNLQLAIDLFWRNKSLVSHEWSPPTREDVLCGTLADRTEFLPDSGITEALQYTTLRAEKGSCLACLLFHNPLASTQNPLDI